MKILLELFELVVLVCIGLLLLYVLFWICSNYISAICEKIWVFISTAKFGG